MEKPYFKVENSSTYAIADLDTVTNIDNSIDNLNFSLPLPLTNTSGNRISNYRGKKRQIVIEGIHTGAGYSSITYPTVRQRVEAFILEVESWVNSGIQTRRVFVDQFQREFNVVCLRFNHRWIEGTEHIGYIFLLEEGGDFINDLGDLT